MRRQTMWLAAGVAVLILGAVWLAFSRAKAAAAKPAQASNAPWTDELAALETACGAPAQYIDRTAKDVVAQGDNRAAVVRYSTKGQAIDFLFTHSFTHEWIMSAAFHADRYGEGELEHSEIVKDLPCSANVEMQSTQFMEQ